MKKLIVAVGILFFPFYLAHAEAVHLHDGSVYIGTVTATTTEIISLDTMNGSLQIKKADIRKIDYEKKPSAEPAEQAPVISAVNPLSPELIFKLGYDFEGSHDVSNAKICDATDCVDFEDSSMDTESGFSISGEAFIYPAGVNLGLGVGATLQTPRKQKDLDGDFYFLPLYGAIKLRTTPRNSRTYLYVLGQLGYNAFYGDDEYKGDGGELTGGLYAGLGAGMAVNDVIIEVLYTENNGSAEQTFFAPSLFTDVTVSGDIKYTKTTLNIGYRFATQ